MLSGRVLNATRQLGARGMDAEQNGHLGRVSLAAVGAPRLNLHSRFTEDGNGRFNS